MPHSPHTISSRTISSVATNTSRVNPTLCHILEVGGRLAQSDAAVGAGGRVGGASRASAAGAGRGGALGRHGLRSPPRQRPQGAGRREAGTVADPADRPSFLPRPTERGWRRAARSPYPFIAPGSRGRGARRPRRQPDALPWRTPRACGQERGEHRNARRTHGLRRCPPE